MRPVVSHVLRPAMYRSRTAEHSNIAIDRRRADGDCLRIILAGVRAVRDSRRLDGRPHGYAVYGHANSARVVAVYCADRRGHGVLFAADLSLSVWRGRGRRLSEHGAHSIALAADRGARPRRWPAMADSAMGRRVCTSDIWHNHARHRHIAGE